MFQFFEKLMSKTLEYLSEGCTASVIKYINGNDINAIKILPLRSNKTDNQEKVSKEIKVMMECDSIFILKMKGTQENMVSMNVFLEFMDKGSLEKVCNDLSLCEESLSYIAWSILKGLEYLKTKSIIHRDIKPANILVNSDGDIKIGDFGEAKIIKNQRAQSIVGTTSYMSPQRVKGEEYSFSADIWSLGITLLEISCKQIPYFLSEYHRTKMNPLRIGIELHQAVLELCETIEYEQEPSLDGDYFSLHFCDFISLCLKKNPIERGTIEELLVFF